MKRKEAIEVYRGEIIKFEGTRNTQWKFNISIWTLLSLAIFFKASLTKSDVWLLVIGLFVIIVHTWFLVQIQNSLECSKKIRELIHNFLNSSEKQSTIPARIRLGYKILLTETHFTFWVSIQIFITILLVIVFLFVPAFTTPKN